MEEFLKAIGEPTPVGDTPKEPPHFKTPAEMAQLLEERRHDWVINELDRVMNSLSVDGQTELWANNPLEHEAELASLLMGLGYEVEYKDFNEKHGPPASWIRVVRMPGAG